MSLRRSLPAGVFDAGGAALGTFAMGVYAVRYLTSDQLGIYALCFVAFTLAAIVPGRGWFLPVEVWLLELPAAARLQGWRLTFRAGLPVALLAAPVALLAWLPLLGEAAGDVLALAATATAAAAISPVQDHVRRLMHLGMRSWLAAAVSTVQVVAVVVALAVGLAGGVPHVWVPFGALAFANVVSTTFGLVLGQRAGSRPAEPSYALARAARSGTWLVLVALLPVGTTFLTSAIVVFLDSSATLGLAEAARIAANPYLVFATGLAGVISPRMIAAGTARDHVAARRLNRVMDVAALAAFVPAALLIGFDWPGNPLASLLPKAYLSGGLVMLSLVARVPSAMALPRFAALLGAGRERDLFWANLAGGLVRVAVAFSVLLVAEYAVPASALAYALVTIMGYRLAFRRHVAAAGPPARVPLDANVP